MATENGTAIKIFVGSLPGKVVHGLTSNEASITRALRDTTNKASGGWKAQEYGLGEGGFSITSNYDADANSSTVYRWEDFLTALFDKTKLTVHFTDAVTGHQRITATCLVTSCPLSAPMEDNATFTVDLAWDGAPTIATVS
jgi:predicted secreted protein